MENIQLIRIVRYLNDNKVNSVGAKMLFSDPCAYHVFGSEQGTEREAFVVNCFVSAGYDVYACKDERKGDSVVMKNGFVANPKICIEVGGKNKNPKAVDYAIKDNIDYPGSKVISMWLLSMML